MDSVLQYGGLLEFDLVLKLISCGADEISVFKCAKSGFTTQLNEKNFPYMVGVHCVAH